MESKKINIENLAEEMPLIKSNETYKIYDLVLEHITASVTILYPGKQTRGHSHEKVEEIYYFLKGKGKMLIGETEESAKEIDIKTGTLVTVPLGYFHRVINSSDENLELLAVFENYKRE